jgi:transposase
VALVQEISEAELIPSSLTGYSYQEVKKTYGGVEQRWLVVQSEKRREADLEKLSSEAILSKYNGQQSVERGFRFLKDPMFLTDSVFVKSPVFSQFIWWFWDNTGKFLI